MPVTSSKNHSFGIFYRRTKSKAVSKSSQKVLFKTVSLFSPLFQGTKYISRIPPSPPSPSPPSGPSNQHGRNQVYTSKLQVASCKLQVASCKLQVENYKLQVENYKLQVAIFKLPLRLLLLLVYIAFSCSIYSLYISNAAYSKLYYMEQGTMSSARDFYSTSTSPVSLIKGVKDLVPS